MFAAIDPFWTMLIQVVATIVTSVIAARHAVAKTVEAQKDLKTDLKTNTDMTFQVEKNTNGNKERQDKIIAALVVSVGTLSTAMGDMRQDVDALKKGVSRISKDESKPSY